MKQMPSASPKAPRTDAPMRRRRGLYADCLRSYLKVIAGLEDDRQLDRILLRTGSRRGLDLLALHATDGRMRLADLLGHVEQDGTSFESLAAASGVPVDPALLVRTARVLALQDQQPDDRGQALSLMRWVYRQAGSAPFRPDHARLYQNLTFDAGDFTEAERLAEELKLSRLDSLLMAADLRNPYGPSNASDEAQWEEIFGRLFRRDGLEAPKVAVAAGVAPFDGLMCAANNPVEDGPLVTVIVTSWQPDTGLETAVRSLLAQSWRNLEILIMDDASPPEYGALLRRIEALDPRIRLNVLPKNGGTYNARNEGLRLARGEFVTGQDSDDWSHPRRIEKQVRALLKKASLVSTTSHAFRCDASLVFNAPGTQSRRENASSLMFRRREVLDRIGFYDTTRKGGDTEFMLRMRRVFGERSHKTLELNLALIRQSRGSLSTSEFRAGWRHPSRAAYRRSYEYWHATADGEALRLDGHLVGQRGFPIPDRFRVDRDAGGGDLDIVFADDLRAVHDPLRLRALLDEVHCAVRAGLSVGLMHLRSFTDISFERIDTFWPPFAKLLQAGSVREVLSTDDASPGTLVIRNPEVAMFLSPLGIQLRPRHLVVAAERPVTNAHRKTWFVPEACHRNLREAFGRTPHWWAAGELKQELPSLLPPGVRVEPAYPVVVDVGAWRAPMRRFDGRRPVLGRIAEGLPTDFPKKREDLLAAYPPTGKTPTRFLGGEEGLLATLRERALPKSWTVLPLRAEDPELFLANCDFFVFFDRGARTPSVRLLAQALASGCVVITSPDHAKDFKNAVLAAEPHEVAGIVDRFTKFPSEFRAQVALGREYVERSAKHELIRLIGRRSPSELKHSDPATPTSPLESHPPVIAGHLRIAQRTGSSLRLDATILRSRSEAGRELLARLASAGSLSTQELLRLGEELRVPARRARVLDSLSSLDGAVVIRFARVLALQNLQPDDLLNGMSLCQAMLDLHGPEILPRKWAKLFFDIAVRLGHYSVAEHLFAVLRFHATDRRLASVDLLHPSRGGAEHDWFRSFNMLFKDVGLQSLSLATSGPGLPRFDRLHSPSLGSFIDEGPLVSIVVTAWCPGPGIKTALRSLISQTWRNLEILVVDDASPSNYSGLFADCAAMDPRIRVLRHSTNSGTYVARNTAMRAASGEFLTFQDSDDYSHPERVERQIRPLIDQEGLLATLSASLRVDSDLVLANPGSAAVQGNASSLMIRREQVVQRIGYFDSVRKAADSEYATRIDAAFGVPALELDLPLALVRLEPNSLSRSEFRPGWRHPARDAYRQAYKVWHEEVRAGRSDPFVPFDQAVRPFPSPLRFRIRQPDDSSFDVILVGDWRHFGGPQKSMVEEIHALSAAGRKIAVCHMEAFRFMTKEKQPLCAPIRKLIHDGIVHEVTVSDPVVASVAILRYPPILQFPSAGIVAWQVGRYAIVANQSPSELDGSDVRYVVGDCIRNARTLFGQNPIWIPQGPQVREALRSLVPPGLLHFEDMPGVLCPDQWNITRRPMSGRRPVIGRYSRDNALKFPAGRDELLAAYLAGAEVDVRIMGGKRTCTALLDECPLPSNWELYEYGAMEVKEFLSQIDVFVYFDNDVIVEAFGRSILEAIASGCVVVLPSKFQPVFGDAALYCNAADVNELVLRLASDEQERERLLARARATLYDRFSYEAYTKRIERLVLQAPVLEGN